MTAAVGDLRLKLKNKALKFLTFLVGKPDMRIKPEMLSYNLGGVVHILIHAS
jgi:hypothetical protein